MLKDCVHLFYVLYLKELFKENNGRMSHDRFKAILGENIVICENDHRKKVKFFTKISLNDHIKIDLREVKT